MKRKQSEQIVEVNDKQHGVFLHTHADIVQIMKARQLIAKGSSMVAQGQAMLANAYSTNHVTAVLSEMPSNEFILTLPSIISSSYQSSISINSSSSNIDHDVTDTESDLTTQQHIPKNTTNTNNTTTNTTTTNNTNVKKVKRVKVPGPKRLSGYLLFCKEMRTREFPQCATNQELVALIGREWSALSSQEKQKYDDHAKELNAIAAHEFRLSQQGGESPDLTMSTTHDTTTHTIDTDKNTTNDTNTTTTNDNTSDIIVKNDPPTPALSTPESITKNGVAVSSVEVADEEKKKKKKQRKSKVSSKVDQV